MFIRYISYELDDLKDSAGLGYPKKKKIIIIPAFIDSLSWYYTFESGICAISVRSRFETGCFKYLSSFNYHMLSKNLYYIESANAMVKVNRVL